MGTTKKTYGELPVVKRTDGTYMRETVPIARYIARHNDLYPTDEIEIWKNDWIVQKH